MSIQFGKINNNIFVNSTATYENGIISISSPENAEKINFYAPSNANDSDLYEINGKQVILSNILNNNPEITWVKGAPISAVYDSQNNKLFINSINGENSLFSNLFRNANAQVIENKIVINSVKEAVDLFNFYSPKAYSANDIYEVNGQVYDVVDLQGNKLESGWNSDVPVSLVLNENKLWYSSNSSDTKLPSDLSPLCPNFRVERNGTKVKISADKIQLNSYTNMVSGGVWAWGKTRPTKPTGENTKQWTRAELITTGKPYDGLYLGDVTPSDAVTETLLWLPENDSGKVKLVPFLVLSTDYLGGVYVMRKYLNSAWKYAYGYPSTYAGGGADIFLTSTYIASVLHESVSSQLLTCTVPFRDGYAEDLERKCWIPSLEELFGPDTPVEDGTYMPYFSSSERRKGYIQDTQTADDYLTRTPQNGTMVYYINERGSAGQDHYSGTAGPIVRPCFVLPKDFKIQQRPDGSYTVWNEQGLMTLGDVEPSTDVIETTVNAAEMYKSSTGPKAIITELSYDKKNYNKTDGGLLVRKELIKDSIAFSAGPGNYLSSYPMIGADEWATAEIGGVTRTDFVLLDSFKKILMSTPIKYRENGTVTKEVTKKGFLLSIDEVGNNHIWGDSATGEEIERYWNQPQNRISYYGNTKKGYWLRDGAGATKDVYTISASGAPVVAVSSNSYGIKVACVVPLTTPIRALADGTYDLVPEDPALSGTTKSISVMAETSGTPIQLRDIPVSTAGNAVMLKIPESEASQREYLYLDNNYKNLDSCLALRKECLPDPTNPGSSNYGSSSMNSKISTWKESLPSLVKKYLVPISISYKTSTSSSSVSQMTESAFLPSEENMNIASSYGDTKYEYFNTNVRRTAKIQDTETNVLYYTRDINTKNTSDYWWYMGITASGSWDNVAYNGSAYLRPMLSISPETWFTDNGDGTYTFVGDEPIADLSIEIDWPESDPLIARQWVYNEKGVYQTMLLGGVASTEDAPAYSPVLAENTWEQIAQACADRDPILDSWLVGDEKDEVINGETLTFVIVGKDHDDLADGSGKAPLTFGMKNLMAETRQMNATNTNAGSFAGSAMYSWLSGTIYPNLPTELKDAIKAVNKQTASGGSSSVIRTDPMYLWLFAEIEVFGTAAYSYAGEGTQYPYFATAAERIKRLSNGAGAASYWWMRSPYRNSNNYFCCVNTSGAAYFDGARDSYGVCFGFCI